MGSEMCIRDSACVANIVIMIGVFSLIEIKYVFQLRLLPGATRSPETARPRQVPPTQQPSRSPAKERASQPNSASDDFSKLLSRRRQVITTCSVGSAVERSILDRASIESPRLCVFCCSTAVCTIIVHAWWDRGLLMDRRFCCTLLYWCTSSETACDTNGHVRTVVRHKNTKSRRTQSQSTPA